MDSPSVAVVVLDTLRKDAFDRYFEWVPGVAFENAYSTAHWTVPAHASLLTGKYPSEVGVHGKSRSFDCPDPSIVEVLHERGYTTRLWTANPLMSKWEDWERGFDHVRGSERLHPYTDESLDWAAFHRSSEGGRLGTYLRALPHALRSPESTVGSLREAARQLRLEDGERGAEAVVERLDRTRFDDREFLLVNLMEAHTPHFPPKPYRSVDERVNFKIGDAFAGLVTDPDRNRAVYDDSAMYLSAVYRGLFRRLRSEFDVVVTLSDHGELLGEYDLWNHGYGLYPELVRVPLAVWLDDRVEADGADADPEEAVSLLDVPETLADLTGVELDTRGRNLLGDSDPVARLTEYQGFLPWHREQFESKGVAEVYERFDTPLRGLVTADGRYVYETHEDGYRSPDGPVSPDDEERLESLVSSVPERAVDDEGSDDVSSDVMGQLEDLGYA
ncbi:sulfatase-like hydrolase/transferase [Candidatus Halobonum tyrrellensis]|uniref:Arylsulfatase n=1 Tax=Candidatus Halobonum tyrrellensis G22 TaxID=1324957 RepID=V4HJU3_9EURY|nr:sulfatase-like hydrolase/transferase [Candidatus Halobonum tyrrellensis]ESP90033.1 arylsulfatase [Candidatus Halobonum tyrrellensis G22]